MPKVPAWQRLIMEGFVKSREEAVAFLMAGKVRLDGQPIRSGGQLLPKGGTLTVQGLDLPYVAKGGLKLAGALAAFSLDPRGRVCIDAGASTGGFTDCLIQHGAEAVYAVDVGFGQLAGSLRQHAQVINKERINIGDASLLSLDPRPELGTVDLSYLSLTKAVPLFAAILHGRGDLICLVKPLFEIDDAAARRSGRIDQSAYAPLLTALAWDLAKAGFPIKGITHSPVTGNSGTLEFFLWIALGDAGLSGDETKEAAHKAVNAALSLPAYHKA